MVARVDKKVESQGMVTRDLTEIEQQVYDMLFLEFLTVKQIAKRRQTSRQAIYKITKKLKEKGLLNDSCHSIVGRVDKIRCYTPMPPLHSIRLHAQEFNIKLIHKPINWLGKVGITLNIDGNTIRCYNESIEIYSGQSFYGKDANEATSVSMSYWNQFFIKLENKLKIIIVKPKYENIKLVKHEYSETNNELASDANLKSYKIRVRSTESGKVWFEIDNSFNLNEAETKGYTAKEDMQEIVQPFFNDLRNNKVMLPSELQSLVGTHIKNTTEVAIALNLLIQMMGGVKKPEDPAPDSSRPDYVG